MHGSHTRAPLDLLNPSRSLRHLPHSVCSTRSQFAACYYRRLILPYPPAKLNKRVEFMPTLLLLSPPFWQRKKESRSDCFPPPTSRRERRGLGSKEERRKKRGFPHIPTHPIPTAPLHNQVWHHQRTKNQPRLPYATSDASLAPGRLDPAVLHSRLFCHRDPLRPSKRTRSP